MPVEIEVVNDPDEIRNIVPVVRSAWGMNNIEQLVKDIVAAMRFHGGLVLLAKEGKEVIGMHFSFPGRRKGRTYLYSHMTGVISGRKYGGVGEQLKTKQREWALENGYDLIAWTYDPLMSLNANFNIHKLGSIARSYEENFYGQMEDALNFGIPTDRFVAEWWLSKEREKPQPPLKHLDATASGPMPDLDALPQVISVVIPEDYVAIKKSDHDRALAIRLRSRLIFKELFSRRYFVVDYDRQSTSYIFSRSSGLHQKYGKNIFSDT